VKNNKSTAAQGNSDQAKLIAGLERRLYEARSEVDRLKAEAVTGGVAQPTPEKKYE